MVLVLLCEPVKIRYPWLCARLKTQFTLGLVPLGVALAGPRSVRLAVCGTLILFLGVEEA